MQELETRLAEVQRVAAEPRVPGRDEVERILGRVETPGLALEDVALLVNAIHAPDFAAIREQVVARSADLRRRLFGDRVVAMAPVEVSNVCASNCLFCGWRSSNLAMDRAQISEDLVMEQVRYLLRKGIRYIELVGGDDFAFVRGSLPSLIRSIRHLPEAEGQPVKICFCTMSLTARQYRELKEIGADAMIVWQETYDAACYRRHIVAGPKARGIDDDWRVTSSGDGFSFRLHAQERALEAGLEVAIGSILGLNDSLSYEVLAVVAHARHLKERRAFGPSFPLVVGMPTWNMITTPSTDNRPAGRASLDRFFSYLSAVYLLALPDEGTWVFPNCRVGIDEQVESTRVAGAFTSTEVKLGPGGYLPALLDEKRQRGENTDALKRLIAFEFGIGVEETADLARTLDRKEQFRHHYHPHETYVQRLHGAGLRLVPFPAA